jgi:uncharacterized protein with FMN-binding domain
MKKSLVALSSAAILTVYGAGYMKTRAAAERFSDEPAQRRPMQPLPATANGPAEPAASAAPSAPVVTTAATAAPAPEVSEPIAPAPAAEAVAPKPSAPVAGAATSKPVAPSTTPATPSATTAAAPAPVAPAPLPAANAAELALTTLPATTLAAAAAAQASPYVDGTYLGWGTCRHGDIQAEVVIAGGKIASAKVAQCLTRYSCSWIAPLPPQVVQRQSPETDYVSGATQSTNAFYYAVVEALAVAKRK